MSSPRPLVVAAAGIEAHHGSPRAPIAGEQLEVGGQVVTAAFLAGFDQADAARVRAPAPAMRRWPQSDANTA